MGLAAEIYEFIKLLLSIVFNNYVIWYLVLTGIIAAAIIKLKKKKTSRILNRFLNFCLYIMRREP